MIQRDVYIINLKIRDPLKRIHGQTLKSTKFTNFVGVRVMTSNAGGPQMHNFKGVFQETLWFDVSLLCDLFKWWRQEIMKHQKSKIDV